MRQIIISGLLCAVLLTPVVQSEAQETTEAQSLTHSMTRSFDPQVYTNLMSQMMTNPMGIMTSPTNTCAQCHTEEDVTRFATTMGPMLQMMNPVSWMNPNFYAQMMTMPMDPATYTKWYEAWLKKYGGMLNQAEPAAEQ